METHGILDEIESLVSDKLQVVSYKWLSRNFLVSSDAAKRLLQEFVKKRGASCQVIYTLSGWMKNDPTSYQVKLVSGSKLNEAQQKFDDSCSIHVYSVQSCLPKDPAVLWNIESVQAEELFKQPSAVSNCLRDNRFCGILSSFVRRNVNGASTSSAATQPKTEGISGSSKVCPEKSVVQQTKLQQPPVVAVQSFNLSNHVKTERQEAGAPADGGDGSLPGKNKMADSAKTAPGKAGGLANLWGQASAKSKLSGVPAKPDNQRPIASADAHNRAVEAMHHEDSDDEPQNFNYRGNAKGESNRKRRFVLDYSDDEVEDAIDLASPELPKGRSSKILVPEKPVSNERSEKKPKFEEQPCNTSSNQVNVKDSSSSRNTSTKISEKIYAHGVEKDSKENLVSNGTSNSPKRRKILKKRIDERGREVNEVFWEGEDTEVKKVDDSVAKKAESKVPNNRGPASKKSPTVGPTALNPVGKPGNKKGGNKDPKQGNIMAFFKKV